MENVTFTGRFAALKPARRAAIAGGIILLLSYLAYAGSFGAQFHFDDVHQIVKNENIRSVENIPRFFTSERMGSYHVELKGYRPMTYASFAVNYALSGYNVRGYHIFNFLLHALNAFLVFLIVGMVLKEEGDKDEPLLPLTAAVIFAVHPIQTNAVTYISGRAQLLSSFFTLVAFYFFIKLRRGAGVPGAAKYAWASAVGASFILGLLSKEMAVCLLGLMAAYDLIFTLPRSGGASRAAKAAFWYIPSLIALAVYLGVRRSLLGFVAVGEHAYGVGEYLISEAKVLLIYLRLLALPVNQNVDYDLPITESFDAHAAVGVLVIAAVLFFIYRLRTRRPAAAFFGLWFIIALLPESSFVPVTDIAVEYRLYLPLAGIVPAAVLLTGGVLKTPEFRRGLAVAIVILLVVLSFNRNRVWANEYTLWSDTVKKSPYSARAHGNYGLALFQNGRYTDAIAELNRSLEIDPFFNQSFNVYNNLGLCYYNLNRFEDALQEFERAARVNPGYVDAYGNMGAALIEMGRLREAEEVLVKATLLDPGYSTAHDNLSKCYIRMGRKLDALAQAREAVKYAPMDFGVNYNLAIVYEANGMTAEAAAQAQAALGFAEDDGQRNDAGSLLARLTGKGGG